MSELSKELHDAFHQYENEAFIYGALRDRLSNSRLRDDFLSLMLDEQRNNLIKAQNKLFEVIIEEKCSEDNKRDGQGH